MEAIEFRLQRLEYREEIRRLVGRYALAMDNKDFELVADIFAANARFAWKDGSFACETRDGIVNMYRTRLAGAGPSFHYTHDQFVDWDDVSPDLASGIVLGHAEVSSAAGQSLVAIRYEDRYLREDGQWRFAERVLGFLYSVPIAEYDGILTKNDRIRLATGARPAHWPERCAAPAVNSSLSK